MGKCCYYGLGPILRGMSRTTATGGYVVVNGRRGGGGRRRVYRRPHRSSRWSRLYAEV